jgi:hypothetical protein
LLVKHHNTTARHIVSSFLAYLKQENTTPFSPGSSFITHHCQSANMGPASHLSIHLPLLSRAGRRSPANNYDNDNDSDSSSKRSSKRSSIRSDNVALPNKQGRPLSLPLLNDAGNPKQNSITHGTLRHRYDDLISTHRRSPLSAIEDVVERPGAPVQSEPPRRRSQTVPVGLPLHVLRDLEVDEDITPRSAARYGLFPNRTQSPDSFIDSPTPTGPKFKRISSPLPPQMPITDRQRHAPPKIPAQQLELVKKDNAQLQEMLAASNEKVNQIMGNLTAEEIRSEELENRSLRLEATLKALTSQQESMMVELKALRMQFTTQTILPPQSVTTPRRSSKRPKAKDNILHDGTIQLEIALRASKLATVTSSDSGSEEWVHPAHRSNTASVRTSLDQEDRSSMGTTSSDASSDMSFSNMTASQIEKFCAADSPSSGPEFWDPSYYEGATAKVVPLSIPSNRLSDIDPLTLITTSTSSSSSTPPANSTLELAALKSRFLALSPIPGTPEAKLPTTAKAATPPRGPSPVLKLNTNLTPRQRGIRVAGVVPAPPHRPSNVHTHASHLRGRSSISNASGNNSSPLARPSGPRPSYAARKMSMQGHLVQTLQPSPENGEKDKDREMKGMYRPERRPSSIVRGLAAQGFGMGANGAPLGMVRRASSYASGHSHSRSSSGTSGSVGSAAEVDCEGMMLAPPPRRASSAWSSACSPKTLKEHYKWVESGRGVEMAG